MSTDGQGRPLSDDGQWAWNGTQWVPAAIGGETQVAGGQDPNATTIAPALGYGANPAPGYGVGSTPPGYGAGPTPAGYGAAPRPGYGADPAPGYGSNPAPGYGSNPAPGYGGGPVPPAASRSRKPLFIGIAAVVVVVVVAVVLIVVLSGSKKKPPLGAFSCTAPGQTGTGVVTFKKGDVYALDGNGVGGTFKLSGDKVTFKGGDLNGVVSAYDSGAKTVKFTYKTNVLTCKG